VWRSLRDGLVLVLGTALRDPDFVGMKASNVGLIRSPRSNDELYGSTTNIASARSAGVDIAIAPDWSIRKRWHAARNRLRVAALWDRIERSPGNGDFNAGQAGSYVWRPDCRQICRFPISWPGNGASGRPIKVRGLRAFFER
jgi:hypothetical protein